MNKNWNSIMFDDIGKKIKAVAKITAWIEIVLSIIGGIVLMIISLIDFEYYGWMFFCAPFAVIIGCISAWLSVIVLYGFGELVDKVSNPIQPNTESAPTTTKPINKLDEKIYKTAEETSVKPTKSNSNDKTSNAKQINETTQDGNPNIYNAPCPYCGEELYITEDMTVFNCPYCNKQIKIV